MKCYIFYMYDGILKIGFSHSQRLTRCALLVYFNLNTKVVQENQLTFMRGIVEMFIKIP